MADVKIPSHAWPHIVEGLIAMGEEWPVEIAAVDLQWLLEEHAAGRRARPPGRPFLAARWKLPDPQVRKLLAELRAQPVELDGPTINYPVDQRLNQDNAGDPPINYPVELDAAPSSRPANPPAPSSPTVEPAQTAQITQFTDSGPGLQPQPAHQRSNLGKKAKSPSPQMSFLNTSIDLDRSQKEKEEGGVPVHTLGIETQTFLQVYTRWASDPKAPKRWRTATPAALAWFLEEIMADPELIAGIDVVVALERWKDWLSAKAEAHGKPGTASGAKFPANWQNALRNWFINEKKFHRSQSGYAAGSVTAPSTNTPARPRRGEYTSSTDPRLQPATPGDYEDEY